MTQTQHSDDIWPQYPPVSDLTLLELDAHAEHDLRRIYELRSLTEMLAEVLV